MSSPGSIPPASVATPDASPKRQMKKKNTADFWRATRFLAPYRHLVIVSIISALFVGMAMAGGFGTMLPILRVLINGDTISNWANRQEVQSRLKLDFASESTNLLVVHVRTNGPAAQAGIKPDDALAPVKYGVNPVSILQRLADPSTDPVTLQLGDGRQLTITNVPPVKWYWVAVRPVIQRLPTSPVASVAIVLAVGVIISAIGNTIRFFQEYYSDKAAILAINDIRRRLYDHVLHVPMEFFGLKGTSDVTSRLVQDCQGLQDGFKTVLGQSIQMPINAAFSFLVAVLISWKLTLFILIFAPVMVAIIQKFGKKMRRASRRALQSSSSMLGQIEGTLSGIRVVKGSNAERFERRRYSRIMAGLTDQQLHMSRIDAISSPTVEVLTLIVVCIVVMWATHLVQVTKELGAEEFLTVMVCLAMIAESLRRFGKVNNVMQRSGAAAARIFETLAIPVERPRHMLGRGERPKLSFTPLTRDICFKDVNFTYPGAVNPALVDVNLTVAKGESVAIVGRNGSGKTTLLTLLPRFYDPNPDAGKVMIDGIDVRDGTLKSLRDQITVVTQDSVIFPGTIAQNIAYGHPMAHYLTQQCSAATELRQKIESAAKRAFAHDFILEKPNGYDTDLTGLGSSLSGGQKQRLNIARAIMRETPILILDEATSQVDAESEHLIQQAIETLMHERTMFVIAHRLGTIRSADRIIVMDRGQIVATGKHEDLLRTSEAYNNLYERQLFAAPPKDDRGEDITPAA
jgi:ATP-binding cassette, subfamily B, bacterial MsbA